MPTLRERLAEAAPHAAPGGSETEQDKLDKVRADGEGMAPAPEAEAEADAEAEREGERKRSKRSRKRPN